MKAIDDQIESVQSDIHSTQSSDGDFVIKVNKDHFDRTLTDLEIIKSNNKEDIRKLTGDYQENSDGTFKSYATEAVNADGVNKIKIHIEAEYKSGDINGYTIKYTEFDSAENILGNVESKLDANGTTIGHDNVEGEMMSDIAVDPPLLVEAISCFSTLESIPVPKNMGTSGEIPKGLVGIVPDRRYLL